MKLLLDTHVVLWSMAGELERLGPDSREAMSDPESIVIVSAVVIWEVAIKRGLGKLDAPSDLLDQLRKAKVELLSVTPEHADRVASLPPIHTDPFDRLLVAQTELEKATLVSADGQLRDYGVRVLVT